MKEIIIGNVINGLVCGGCGVFSVWLTIAANKFNLLKDKHKEHARTMAKIANDPQTSGDVKIGIMENPTTKKLVDEGLSVDDDILKFENNWKQFIKCILRPF